MILKLQQLAHIYCYKFDQRRWTCFVFDSIDYSVAESAYPSLDAEAIRVVELFQPEYSPAEKDGKKVKIKVQLPITFRLERG
jgi:hypothetical protein